jgi:uncharacterized protein with NRDE domain
MCTILLAWRIVPGTPIVLAANRDELLERASLPPHLLREGPPVVAGGRDVLAGGTWMAVREDGTVAAVTNRRSQARDPSRRSRGELPLMLLDTPDDAGAGALLRGLDPTAYNPFNALHVSPRRAVVAEVHGELLRVRDLEPGLHVLTVYDLDDPGLPKVDFLAAAFAAAAADAAGPAALLEAMEEILRDHGDPPRRQGAEAACVHMGVYGTVSSSSVMVHHGGAITYRHAPGKPCVTPHTDVSALLGVRV